MTNINIYCLFDGSNELYGVYSSIKGISAVYMKNADGVQKPSITLLRNIFKGEMDVKTQYVSDICTVTILKTGLKE